VLATLEVAELERSLKKAELDLDTAKKRLQEAQLDQQDALTEARLKLETARSDQENAEASLANALAKAKVDLGIKRLQLQKLQAQDPTPRKARAEVNLAQARAALQRGQAAYDAVAWRSDVGATPQAAALQQATADFQRAQADYDLVMQDIASAAYDLAIAQQTVVLAELEVRRLEGARVDHRYVEAVELAQIRMDKLELGVAASVTQAVAAAELEIGRLKAQIADAQIVSPMDGKVVMLSVVAGRNAEAFKPVVIVADPGRVELGADLSAAQLADLTQGQSVEVVFSRQSDVTWQGMVHQLPYAAGSTGKEQAAADNSTRIAVDGDLSALSLGELAQVRVLLQKKEGVLWLPPEAIRTFQDRAFVIVQDADRQRRADVRLGIQSKDRVEILEGLQEGQKVVGQ
jgi:multidrug efflux pump subunit AcrA (membrane-fusion protein)